MAKEKIDNKKADKKKKVKQGVTIDKQNYIIAGVGVVIVVLGYALFTIDKTVDGVLSLYVAPISVIVGYIIVGIGIVYKKKDLDTSPN